MTAAPSARVAGKPSTRPNPRACGALPTTIVVGQRHYRRHGTELLQAPATAPPWATKPGGGGKGPGIYLTRPMASWSAPTTLSVPGYPGFGALYGVNCSDANDCTAVGQANPPGTGAPPCTRPRRAGLGARPLFSRALRGTGDSPASAASTSPDCIAVGVDGNDEPIYANSYAAVVPIVTSVAPTVSSIRPSGGHIDWFNHRRLHGEITEDNSYVTPAEFEAIFTVKHNPRLPTSPSNSLESEDSPWNLAFALMRQTVDSPAFTTATDTGESWWCENYGPW